VHRTYVYLNSDLLLLYALFRTVPIGEFQLSAQTLQLSVELSVQWSCAATKAGAMHH